MNIICISPIDLSHLYTWVGERQEYGRYNSTGVQRFIRNEPHGRSNSTIVRGMDAALTWNRKQLYWTKCLAQDRSRIWVLGDGVIQLHYKGTGKFADNGLKTSHEKWTFCGVLR